MTTALAPASCTATALDHLSWSGIKTYASCPRKFYYHYIAGVPDEFVPASLAFGGSFHSAVETLQQAQIEGAAIPSVEVLMEAYGRAWKEQTARAPAVTYPKTEDEVTLHELAERMLNAYRDHVLQSASGAGAQIIAIEHKHRFRLLADVPPIEMRLDLLELDGSDLIVTDLKTSRSKWNDEKVRESLGQLVLYANGLVPLLKELGAKRIVPRFLVVTKAKKPVVQVLEPHATQEDVVRLKEQVADTWSAIKAGVFVPRESWMCAQCPYKKRCLG